MDAGGNDDNGQGDELTHPQAAAAAMAGTGRPAAIAAGHVSTATISLAAAP